MIGPLEFAPQELCVSVAGKRVRAAGAATRRELEVLEVLAQSAGHPVARDEVHRRVWGGRVAGFKDRSVEVYIRRLRVKLAAAGPDWDHIHTHHNIGLPLGSRAARARWRQAAVITIHQHLSMERS